MHNINLIFQNKKDFLKKINKRGEDFTKKINDLEKLNELRKNLILKIETTKSEKNKLSKDISFLMKEKKINEANKIKKNILKIDDSIIKEEQDLSDILKKINTELSYLPNIVDDSVPEGKNEDYNIEIRRWEGEGLKESKYEHSESAISLNILNLKRAVKLSGSRFAMYTNKGSKLVRSIIDILININTKNGYEEQWLPLLVNREIMYGTSQLPKFEDDAYKTTDDQFLIPTAEVPLTNLYKDEEININDLPIKLTAFTQCFRKESGSAGRDTKGIIRLHQFNKVELVKLVKPENSHNELELMVKNVEEILKTFELPYRVLELCSGDIGFGASKTYDLEVWMSSQNKFREISSCSNCLDFQAQRINLKYRDDDKKLKFVHTLNGSGIAIDRLIAAIIEYNFDGKKMKLPKILRNYFDNEEYI